MVTEEEFFLIDKDVVTKHDSFLFNVYGKNTPEEELSLIYEKGVNTLESVHSVRYLYIHKQHKDLYEGHYNSSPLKVIPEDLKIFYKNVAHRVNTLFENPTSKEHVEEAKKVVTDMVDIIFEDDFTVSSLVTILSFDYATHTHSLNVSAYAICLGKRIGLDKKHLQELGTAALLHDLGKTKIKPEILHKHGKLTEKEFHEMQNHPFYGWLLARKVGITSTNILAGIRNHHEKFDGTGYPDKLKGKEIHLYARIIAVSDVFDAITTNKSYKDARSTFDTLIMMKKEMSNHLDPNVINHFIAIFKSE